MSHLAIVSRAVALCLGTLPVACASAGPVEPGWSIAREESPAHRPEGLDRIRNIVVIYGENRSFDNLYGDFPGANGLANAARHGAIAQRDRDGSVLPTLPPIWGGLPGIAQAATSNLPNAPFSIDAGDPGRGFSVPLSVATRDVVHRFYQNQMQIDGGANDLFAAWTDAGALTMGHYDTSPSALPMWQVARNYVLADNFYFGTFGGSFLNHQYLICACIPFQANPNDLSVAAVNPDGVSLATAPASPASALAGPPSYILDGRQTPDHYAVNTSQPAFQPSGNPPAAGGDTRYANADAASTLSVQTQTTIGDLLSAAHVSWAWYAGAFQDALDNPSHIYTAPYQFQPHHQPFNYFANYAPGTAERAQHLKDGGIGGAGLLADIDAGRLPAVTFYKPQGTLNEHPGYANVLDGDAHIADVISHILHGPQADHVLIVVTYDENGGFWDHAAPPKADRWGPGSRVPTIIVSPYARKGHVDHTPYDTSSILRFIAKRYLGTKRHPIYPGDLLPGIAERDAALHANGFRRPGDLTGALKLD
jgi:acid phosphatase